MKIFRESHIKILSIQSFSQSKTLKKNECGEILWFKIHDIAHEFARFLTQNEYFSIINKDFERLNIEISF